MSDLRIDYSGLRPEVGEGERPEGVAGEGAGGVGSLGGRIAAWCAVAALLAVLPFALLIRGGVFAYRVWALGTWPSLVLSAAATALLLAAYAWIVGHRFGAGRGVRRVFTRAAAGVAIAYVGYALLFVASANVKSPEVRAEYAAVHPLLRVASSALILVDASSVITDAGRTEDDHWLMGLSPNEASLHFAQDNGYVHALDLRTAGRPEWRNRAVELAFWALGFHSLRHVGTADHPHVSLRLPA